MPTPTSPQTSPVIAIVGRPNVGKSSIFNRLAGKRIAIVHDQPGVTRDRIEAECRATRHPARLLDTGGIGAPLDDGFAEQVRAEADVAIAAADLILLVVDGRDGLHPVDQDLANELRRGEKPVALVVNKIDEARHENLSAEFSRLGYDTLFAISAAHGRGFSPLIDWLDAGLAPLAAAADESSDREKAASAQPIHLALLGRPNVGKSSLANVLLGEQRAIVSDIAGTTRDSVDVAFEKGGIAYRLIDTAGLRPRGRRDTSVEVFSAMRTASSLERCDIALLVVEATGVTAQDRKIAKMILDAGKPCCILVNKFDLYHPGAPHRERIEALTEEVRRELFFLPHAPVAATSALKGKAVTRLFQMLDTVRLAARERIGTGPLNRLLQDALTANPPPLVSKRHRLKLLYATNATATEGSPVPVPTFMLFINRADLLSPTYRRYLENRIRQELPYPGLPIHFVLRTRRSEKARG